MWFLKRNRKQATKAPMRGTELRVAMTPEMRKRLVIAASSSAIVVVVVWSVLALLDRPVRHIELAGQFLRVSPPQVEQVVLAFTKSDANADRGFISLDLEKLKAVVERIDWVDQVRIERRWPSGVRLTIGEQVPGARWGERGLLNARGELFLKDARYIPPELPQLNGPEGTESQVARLYLDTYPRLAVVGLRLARVTLDPRGAWELTVTSTQATATNNGGVVVRLGRQDVAERLERFLEAASPLIAARSGEMHYVDMRYSNGFAVGWTKAASLANKQNTQGSKPDA
jgi:cell division protein FtsQ